MKKVLLAGESWMSYTTHVKGFDSFYTSTYETGEKWLVAALEKKGYEVTFLPNHLAADQFPFTMEELKKTGVSCHFPFASTPEKVRYPPIINREPPSST